MTDIQKEMQQMQTNEASKLSQEFKQQQEHSADQERNEIQLFFRKVAQEFIGGDPALYLGEEPVGQIGFLIIYLAEQGWNSKQFTISATIDKGNVEITAADGKWEEIPNFNGNWGNWSDQKTVYTGSVNLEKIRKVLEQQFLAWYQAALKADSH